MTTPAHPSDQTRLSRRSLAIGTAWAVPTIAMASAAPAFAISPTKVPGINGWVNNDSASQGGCSYKLSVRDTGTEATPDGAPWGLYIYDVESMNTFADAKLVYWIIGDHSTQNLVTWTSLTDHSPCWSQPVKGTPRAKADGLTYTPYTFSYTCPLLASNAVKDPDGYTRLYLGAFRVQASFTQPSALCANVTYWTERFITIDPDGAGWRPPVTQTFERRNGTLGPYTTARARARQPLSDTSGGGPS